MKLLLSIPCLATLALLLLSGCARHYQITLSNHRVITTHGKPKVDEKQGVVRFTDAEGKKHVIPTITIQSIEPK
jgi:hypothetical protein